MARQRHAPTLRLVFRPTRPGAEAQASGDDTLRVGKWVMEWLCMVNDGEFMGYKWIIYE